MVLSSSSVLACLLPARLAFPSSTKPVQHTLGEPEPDPFRGNPLPRHRAAAAAPDPPRARANTAPSLLVPNGDVGESPRPAPGRIKRSSWAAFFAFSSKRRPVHAGPVPHAPSVPGRQAHLVNPASVPSPLQTDDEEYYYSYYYPSLSPTLPPHPASPQPNSAHRSPRQQDPVGNPELDSQTSSPVDPRPHHTHIYHPYAYSTPLASNPYTNPAEIPPSLRHATSQPFRRDPHPDINTGLAHARTPSSHLGHGPSKAQPDHLQPQLKTSMSTPNLASAAAPARLRSLLRKKPARSKGQERWLSAETWWDALLSPSPRFKVKQAPRPTTAPGSNVPDPVSNPVPDQPERDLGITFPSVPAPRPRAASTTSVSLSARPTHSALTRSQSTTDLLGQPSTSAGFEPALETLVDESIAAPDPAPGSEPELPFPEPPLSLEQVIDEGAAFEQQRAQWKQQATKSLGNKHTRSISRARSKSLGAKHSHGHNTSESGKPQFNLEFLAARTLLGSQSTMPTVHVTKPSSSSSRSKAYSHSHSQSAYSHSHTSHSRAYSHSHSHSLTTSNSSKSSRNFLSRGHSRNGSWSKTAFLKAGALCGIGQDDSCIADEKAPSSSRVDVQGTVHMANSTHTRAESDTAKALQNTPSGEVGVAISSSSPLEGGFDLKVPGHPYVSGARHREGDQESRWSSKYTYKSSEYAGPHPSAIDTNLPQLGAASDVSLRHRLPPRAAIHPPIVPIAHPYRSASAQPEQAGDKGSEGTPLKIPKGQEATEPSSEHISYPHISLSHADFERYGVGEALVYAAQPRPAEVQEAKQISVESESEFSPVIELTPPEQQSPRGTVVLQPEMETSSLAMNSSPSLTSSTIQMVMSALDNPDDLDEFQDLFYKPQPVAGDQRQELSVAVNRVPTDVHSSASSSPLTHLVRKLSEEVHGRRDLSRTPSDPTRLQRSESLDKSSNESGTKFVLTDPAQASSSPSPMESSPQLHLRIEKGSGSTAQPVVVIPDDVNSSYTASVLGSPEEYENDTFGYPIKLGQFEAATTPAIQSSERDSTHPSVEDDGDGDKSTPLSPVTTRFGLSTAEADAVRSSYLTTSDMSQMSALSDFPLPPGVQPSGHPDRMSILDSYFEATPSPLSQSHDETEVGQEERCTDEETDAEPSGDVNETLRALRMMPRMTSFENRRSTFGGSDDMDFITQLHQS